MFQETHQRTDFLRRAVPIFLRKGVNREGLNAKFQAQADHLPYGVDAFTVTSNTGKSTEFRPTSVAVHDHGDMFREEVQLQLRG